MPIEPNDRPLVRAADEIFQVINAIVVALKSQPDCQVEKFDHAIREFMKVQNLGLQAQAALQKMLENPWEGLSMSSDAPSDDDA